MIRVGMTLSMVRQIQERIDPKVEDFEAAFDEKARAHGFKFDEEHCTCESPGSCMWGCGWYAEVNF